MSIRRAPHEFDYVIIRNDALRDVRLSYKARGLLAMLLSMPDTWVVNSDWLVTQGTDGRSSVLTGLRELEDCGYLRRSSFRDENGQWAHDSVIYESPTQNDVDFRVADFRTSDNRVSENRTCKEVPIQEGPIEEVPIERTHSKATRIPDKWVIDQEMRDWAEEHTPSVNVSRESHKFVDHYKSVAGARALKRDWRRTWQNWMRRAEDGF